MSSDEHIHWYLTLYLHLVIVVGRSGLLVLVGLTILPLTWCGRLSPPGAPETCSRPPWSVPVERYVTFKVLWLDFLYGHSLVLSLNKWADKHLCLFFLPGNGDEEGDPHTAGRRRRWHGERNCTSNMQKTEIYIFWIKSWIILSNCLFQWHFSSAKSTAVEKYKASIREYSELCLKN